jgi:acyl-CoA thioester hydrolase
MSMSDAFRFPLQVTAEHIDVMKHVNNEFYLSWIVRAATSHSAAVGYDVKKYFSDGAAFVVRRHEIDYLVSAVLNDELSIETWVEEHVGAKTIRRSRIIRTRDQKVLVEAKTIWVYVKILTGRPTAIPPELVQAFANFTPSGSST